jgi:ligand-binding sensor protein
MKKDRKKGLDGLLSSEEWEEVEKDIYARSGLASNIFDVKGVRITGFRKWVNRLCPEVKADERGQSFICAVAHMNYAEMARQKKGPVIGECDAGLLKLVTPIFVTEEFLGTVGACGLLPDDGEIDSFMVNRTINMDEERIKDLSHDIKKISSKEVRELVQYIEERIEKITKKS